MACLSETCPADTNLEDTEKPSVLFEIQYEQSRQSSASIITDQGCDLPTPSLDLAFDDAALDTVEEAWRKIMGESATLYMTFKPREQFDDEDDE